VNEIERVREQAAAWEAVFEALEKAAPKFYKLAPKGVDAAVLAIDSFARRLAVAQRMADALRALFAEGMVLCETRHEKVVQEAARAALAEWEATR
jgi:ribosomal protein S18 acetylase RimI-like enzyme